MTETDGTIEAALDWLRIQGVATALKKATQTAANGFIGIVASDDRSKAAMVEVNCVTDFVEKNVNFQNASLNIANTIQQSADLIGQTKELNIGTNCYCFFFSKIIVFLRNVFNNKTHHLKTETKKLIHKRWYPRYKCD